MPGFDAGVRLTLLLGDAVVLPAPEPVVAALRSIEVTTDDRNGDGFQLRLAVGRDVAVDSAIVAGPLLAPMRRVVIVVHAGAVPQTLFDGVITRQDVTAGDEPGTSTLAVTGRDLSQVLDLEERNAEYPNQPDAFIFASVIGRYARYGLVPRPAPTKDFPLQLDRIPRQVETDLALVRRLAERNGFVFYVEPLAPGASAAVLGPQPRLGLPQPAITVGMGAATNATGVSFTVDGLAPVSVKGSFVDPVLKRTWPLPALPPLKVPPLAARPAPAWRSRLERETAQRNPAQAALAGVAAATSAPDAVTARGTLDTARYGHVLRPRGPVGLRGAGFTHDGLYYVRSVSHAIAPGTYTQQFELSREGTGSITPVVRP